MRVSLLFWVLPLALFAQPKPGDVFREYRYTSDMIVEFDAASKREDPKAKLRRSISQRERNLDIWDLEDATRAEIALEFWGGHPGTSGQALRVNGNAFHQIPQIEGTPTDPRCYFRTLPGTAIVPIPLSELKQGRNLFEFRAGSQVCHSIDWGIYKVYAFIVRVYYNETKARPNGRVQLAGGGSVIGDLPVFEAVAEGSPAAPGKTEFTPGPVRQVDFIAHYEDFNWTGDGKSRAWQYQTEQGELRQHVGSSTRAPYRVTWQNEWIPDQAQPVQVSARITSVHGITYMTPPATFTLRRGDRSVKMFGARDIPEVFGVRIGKTAKAPIDINVDPQKATAARLAISTWAGNHADAFGFNGQKIIDRVGKDDYYSYDLVPFDPAVLREGKNEFYVFSDTKEHTVEINWPGPAVLLEFKKGLTPVAGSPAFSEGPVFDAQGNFYFSHRDGITRLAPDGRTTFWVKDGAAGFHGHKILANGQHLVCAMKRSAVLRLKPDASEAAPPVTASDRGPIKEPNDIALDQHGGFYLTDPFGTRTEALGRVYYVDAKGRATVVLDDIKTPNGAAVAANGRYLYLAETGENRILRFPVLKPGHLGKRELFANLPDRPGHQAAPDGLLLDAQGNLLVAQIGRGKVIQLDPNGRFLREWDAGNYDASNLAFSPKNPNELYVTGSLEHRARSAGRVFRLELQGGKK